jgi:solute carrier family 30 (zinc transporter), member 2
MVIEVVGGYFAGRCVGAASMPLPVRTRNDHRHILCHQSWVLYACLVPPILGLPCSVAVMADAAHMFSDVLAFVISAYCTYMVAKRSSASYSFGYHRAETVGALISILIICVITGALVLEAIQRLLEPQPINGRLMFIIAVVGIGFNLLLLMTLGHGHHHHGPGGSCGGHGHDAGHTDGHDHNHGHDHGHECGGHNHAHARPPATAALEAAAMYVGNIGTVPDVHADGSVPEAVHGIGSSQEHHEVAVSGSVDAHSHANNLPLCCSGHAGLETAQDAEQHVVLRQSLNHECGHLDNHDPGHDHDHGHDGANQNLRGAILHVIGDLLQSFGVAMAGMIIWCACR